MALPFDRVAPGKTMSVDRIVLPFPFGSKSVHRRAFRKQLRHALCFSASPVIVDLSGHRTLDCRDINLLLDCAAQVTGRDSQLIFLVGSLAIRLVLDVVRISSLVPVLDAIEQAPDYGRIMREGPR